LSRTLNRAEIIGNLGRDAETTYTASQVPVTKFSIATTRRFKKGDDFIEETIWHNVVLWRSEAVAKFLLKGKQVYVEGYINNRSYEDKDGKKVWTSEIVAENVILLGGDRSSDNTDEARGNVAARPQPPVAPVDDDVPF